MGSFEVVRISKNPMEFRVFIDESSIQFKSLSSIDTFALLGGSLHNILSLFIDATLFLITFLSLRCVYWSHLLLDKMAAILADDIFKYIFQRHCFMKLCII